MLNKIKILMLCLSLAVSLKAFSQDITGFWKIVDDETNQPQSLVAIYEYKNKYYGRLIATFDDGKLNDTIQDPKSHAPGVKGHPFYSGLDFIWDLEKEGSKYVNGVILDPKKGEEYAAEAWLENGNLIVRGEILFMGRNETWPPAQDSDFPAGFIKPHLKTLVPKIPEVE